MQGEASHDRKTPSAGVVLEIPGDMLPSGAELRRMVERAQRERPAQVVPPPARGLTRSRRLAIQTIRIYQRWISPRLKPRCLLEPSCSHYAALAVEHHGLVGGGIATARRLRRCVPANAGLIDYPEGVTVGLPHRQHRQGLHRQNA